MEYRRTAKRKSPSQDYIFEISDDDVSLGHHESDCDEPDPKVLRRESVPFHLSHEDSNHVPILETPSNTDEIINLTEEPLNGSAPECNVEKELPEPACLPEGSKSLEADLEEGEVEENESTKDELDSKDETSICITFANEAIADQYKFKFLKFIASFVEFEIVHEDELTISLRRDHDLDPSEWVVVDDTIRINPEINVLLEEKLASPLPVTPEKLSPKKKKKKKEKKAQDMFVVDPNPSKNESTVKYMSKFEIDIEKNVENEDVLKISAQSCFNCDKNHSIRDCPLPKDYNKINAMRMKFKSQKLTSRYHLEEEQKFSNLKPGVISGKLREALGLRKGQIPPFIYQMRVMGYPPGWLEEAKIVHSNLAMFDSEGKDLRTANSKLKHGLDPQRIVDYPGFNVPPENNVKDEYRQYRVPPYSENFSKKAMLEYFDKQFTSKEDDLEICDIVLDKTQKDEAEKTDGNFVQIPTKALKHINVIDVETPSLSLVDLEKQKQNLLAALDDSTSSIPKSDENAGEEPEIADTESQDSGGQGPINENLTIDITKAENSSSSDTSPPGNAINSSKKQTLGTPILKSSSPYSRLPNADNFMKDVSPMINFENLPNSTGKYEQMSNVIQKVRNTMKYLQNCS